MKAKYTVLITTSGIGGRLGDLTKYTNKALIRIGKKPSLSYIIEAYPKNTEFVITLGYYGNQIKEFLKLSYPKLKFTFIEVDKYKGEGSSLGYSMLQAAKVLNKPFIFHASDTIVLDKIPPPSKNWIGGYSGPGSSSYTSFNVLNGRIQRIMEKGILDPDYLHIGLVGVNDYANFWNALRKLYKNHPKDRTLADVDVLNQLIADGDEFEVIEFKTWYDTGNADALNRSRKELGDSFVNLDKPTESIYLFDKFVVKFFYSKDLVNDRIKRARILNGLVPPIKQRTEHFYKYSYVEGDLFSDVVTPRSFLEFLEWCEKKLWRKTKEVSDAEFKKVCLDFYKNKTEERIDEFLRKYSLKDSTNVINEETVPTLSDLFKRVDFDWLSNSKQTNFHGDLILDNIIKRERKFTLLDIRQNFGGLLKSGDMYYDLGKLNHNLTVNHAIISKNQFQVEVKKDLVRVDILRRENLIQSQQVLMEYMAKKELDARKVKILTPIIWLNMSPLHEHPFGLFLFYFGKYNLWRALNEA